MSVGDAWNTLLTLLQEEAPVNAADLTPPLDPARRRELLRAFPVVTPELEQWFGLHDGQVPSALTDNTGRVRSALGPFPSHARMLGLDEVLDSWKSLNSVWVDWPERVGNAPETSSANTKLGYYTPEYVPILSFDDGSYLFVDARSGDHSGCVRYWADGDGDLPALWSSITEMIDAAIHVADTGHLEQGQIVWELPAWPERFPDWP